MTNSTDSGKGGGGGKLAPTPNNIGAVLARNMFKSRGNHFEIHLTEPDLELLLKGAAEIALEGVSTANVEALNKTRDQLVEALKAAEQCVGELPPTQARVETMQIIQSALASATGERE